MGRGRAVCLTGSNASLLGRELGAKLTGRHLSFEVFPFSYREYCAYAGHRPGAVSLRAYLDDGGFPAFLRERDDHVLQELLRDIVQRDVAARHRLRDTRHVMTLLLFLLANSGQAFSFQRLTKTLQVPTVAQHLRRRSQDVTYAGERDAWDCDFITGDEAVQVCWELTPANRRRELGGAIAATRLKGARRARVVTFDQTDRLREEDVTIDVVPAWQWLA